MSNLFQEAPEVGNHYRERQVAELSAWIDTQRERAHIKRQAYFKPSLRSVEQYQKDTDNYRQALKRMLGWPLAAWKDAGASSVPKATVEFVAEDEVSRIFRMEIEVAPGLSCYGIYFTPAGKGPFPLVICQHGGMGTPELCSGFYGPTSYNDMARRVIRKGAAVFAPQLFLRWNEEVYGPAYSRERADNQLKQLGSSIAALELFKIVRSIDYLTSRDDIWPDQLGMIGLSYGGFYTLYTAAVDPRIKAAYSSCFVNDRLVYDWQDFTWFNSAHTFLDAEVCGLICPRALYLEVGREDELFNYQSALPVIASVKQVYEQLGLQKRFSHDVFEGAHELCKEDEGIDFLIHHVRAEVVK